MEFESSSYREENATYLNDFLVRHTSQENVLFVGVWMEFDYIGDFAITEALKTLPSLGVPELHLTIVSTRKELFAIVGET